MARDKENHDFLPSIVAALERPPAFCTRAVSLLVILLTIIAGMWAFFSKTDIIVSAQGEIVPAGRVKTVQAAEPGIVRDIYVQDGQVVKAGAELIELDGTASKAEEAQLRIRRARAMLTIQRLRAELGEAVHIGSGIDLPKQAIATEKRLYRANERYFSEAIIQLQHKRDESRVALAVAQRQMDKLRTRIAHLKFKVARSRVQAKKGLVPGQQVQDTEFELETARRELAIHKEKLRKAEIRMAAAQEKLESGRMKRDSGLYRDLAKTEYELKTIDQELVKARQRTAHQVFRAPVSGVVQQLTVHTIGAVVKRGQNLMTIVPRNAGLQMDAKVLNKDIGFIEEQQPARIKVNAFEFTRYGHIDGELQWVGSDAVVDEKKGPVYPVRLSLAATSMHRPAGGREAAIVAGMRATADIVIGQRRLIEYFIEPLLRYRDESLRER